MNCCNNKKISEYDIDDWGELIQHTNLTQLEKDATIKRVISVVRRLRRRLTRLSTAYIALKTTTTVGSLLVPSLLAIQNTGNQELTYWTMWGVGLLVSMSNAFVSLFRVDKNFFTVGNLIEKIESEAWMFLTQSGTYKQDADTSSTQSDGTYYPNHRATFQKFMERCEILMNKAIQSEYIIQNVNNKHISSSSSIGSANGLTPFPPPMLKKQNLREATEHEAKLYKEMDVELSSEVVALSVDDTTHSDNSDHRSSDIVNSPSSSDTEHRDDGRISGTNRGNIKVVVQ